MHPKTSNLRHREPSNGDDAHLDASTDPQTVDSNPSEMKTIHSLNLLQQEEFARLLSFGNDSLPNDTDFDDISSHNATSVPPLTDAVSTTNFETNMPLSNNLQTSLFGITQSLDTSAHVIAIDLASTSTINALHDITYTVQPQRRLTLPKIQSPVYQEIPWLGCIGFVFFPLPPTALQVCKRQRLSTYKILSLESQKHELQVVVLVLRRASMHYLD